jgi:OmpA-OmpF porin, OOP family
MLVYELKGSFKRKLYGDETLMKNFLIVMGLCLFSFAAIGQIQSPKRYSTAQDNKQQYYLGLGYGSASQEDIKASNGATMTSTSKTDSTMKIYGGYSFNPNFALEASYGSLGKVIYSSGSVMWNGLELSGLFKMPVSSGLRVFGKLGVSRVSAKDEWSSGSVSSTSTGLVYGLGLMYALSQNVNLRGEYDRRGTTLTYPNGVDVTTTASIFGLSVDYNF